MVTQTLTLEPVAKIAWDFSLPSGHNQKKVNRGEEPVAQNVALQVAMPVFDVWKPSIPRCYHSMPPEIQGMIWAEKLRKPGLHFLAVHVFPVFKLHNSNSAGVSKIILTEISHDVSELEYPYRTYFPKGMRSAHNEWAELSRTFPFARDAMKQAFIQPLTIPTPSGDDIVIDAATDLLYLKFHWKPVKARRPQYIQSPAYWMLVLDNSELKGIRHVAFEFDKFEDCVFWPSEVKDICGFCDDPMEEHDEDISSELWLIADFLHCFQDLESVYLVFKDIEQGPVDRGHDMRYTVSGRPDVHAIQTDPSRWDSSPGLTFRCDGGYVRELRGTHVILPIAHISEALHAYYVFHCKTAIGQVEAVSKRKRADRLNVKFKLAICQKEK